MHKPYSKKLLASTLAFAILLGSSLVYTAGSRALASDQTSSGQQQNEANDRHSTLDQLKKKFAKRQTGHQRQKTGIPMIEEAASLLGMDKDALTEALKDKSLADIAKERGISADDLVAKLQAERGKKIDEAVAKGALTAEKAEKLKAGMSKHLSFMVHKKGLHKLGQEHHMKRHPFMKESLDHVAQIFGMSKDDLRAELKAGKSLTEIAEAKGIGKDQLIAKLKEQMTPLIEKMVDEKREAKSSPGN